MVWLSSPPRAEPPVPPAGDADNFGLTFIVPSYNRHDSLCRLLSSLRREATCSGFQVIVVDDGSRDATRHLVSDELVTYLHQTNAGPAAARNTGARAARSTYLAFVDDDCEVSPGYVERVRVEATQRGGVVFGGPAMPLKVPGRRPSMVGRYLRASRQLQEPITDSSGRIICLASANLIIRRDVFWEAGGFFKRITRAGGEDSHLTLKLRELGYPCRFLHDLVVFHDVDIGLVEMLRKYFRYGVGAAWTAHQLGLPPQSVGLLATDSSTVLRAPLQTVGRLLGYTRYLQMMAWLEALPPIQRMAVGSLAFGETLPAFLGGLIGGAMARRAEANLPAPAAASGSVTTSSP